MYRLALLMIGALLAGTPAAAQPCASTPATVVEPHIEPAITGSVCRLDRGIAYVAGSQLTLVDVNIWDQPLATGSVPLPAAALAIAVVWPRVYVACGDAGVVEVDVRHPAAPVVTRSYNPAGFVRDLVAVNGDIVALDDTSNLHLLDTGSGGPLVAAAIQRWPWASKLAEARGYLVINDATHLSTVRGFSNSGFDMAGVIAHEDSPHLFAMAASGDKIGYLVLWFNVSDYGAEWVQDITAFQVSPQGALSQLARHTNIAGDPNALGVAAAGGWFLQARAGYPSEVTVRRTGDLSIQATLPLGGAAISSDGHLVVAVGDGGLATLPLDPVLPRPQPRDVVGNGEIELGPDYNRTTRSAQWSGRFGLLESTTVSYSGGVFGGRRITRDYALVSGDGPDSWTTITSGRVSQSSPRGEETTYGSANLRLADGRANRAILVLDGCPRPGIIVADGGSGAVVHRDVPQYMYSNNYCGAQNSYAAGLLWYTDGTMILCLDIEGALPLAPVDVTAAIAPGRLLAADRDLLVVYHEDTGTYDTYDTSDLADIRLVGSLLPTPAIWPGNTAWLGRRFVARGATSLGVIDFTDPAAPVVRSHVTLPYSTAGMTFDSDRVVLRCDENLYIPPRRSCRFQVADLAADGTVTLHAPSDAIPTTDDVTSQSCVLSGSILYADLGYAVRAYDLTDPEHPVAVGETRNGSGMVAIFGEYLASGSLLSPRHCLDLPPVRRVAIEVLRMLKPAAAGALVEVAVCPSPGFDPALIDVATVRFGPAAAAPVPAPANAPAATRRPRVAPSDGDPATASGVSFWFRLDEAGITAATATATLDARTLTGEHVQGSVRLDVPPPAADTDAVLAVSPNPFNPQTTLSYTLPEAGPCSLVIYDLRGRRVRVLAEGARPAGDHVAVWDGRDERGTNVASGVYLARLVHQGGSRTQRLALTR